MTVQQFLINLASGGAGPLLSMFLEDWRWFQELPKPEYRRWLAYLFSAGIGVLAWGVGVLLRVFEMPTGDWTTWVIAIGNIFLAGAGNYVTASLNHSRYMAQK